MTPLGMISALILTPFLPSAPQTLALRRWPGWSMQLSLLFVGADAHIGPSLGTTGDAPVGRGDRTPPHQAYSDPSVGGGLRPAPLGKASVLHQFPLALKRLPTPRRGGPMCPPVMPPARNRTRADTQVGPYRSSIPP